MCKTNIRLDQIENLSLKTNTCTLLNMFAIRLFCKLTLNPLMC